MRSRPPTRCVSPGDDEDDEDDEEYDDNRFGEIEGSKEEDVGWCKVKTFTLMPSSFSTLCHPNAWYRFYRRPAAMVR